MPDVSNSIFSFCNNLLIFKMAKSWAIIQELDEAAIAEDITPINYSIMQPHTLNGRVNTLTNVRLRHYGNII